MEDKLGVRIRRFSRHVRDNGYIPRIWAAIFFVPATIKVFAPDWAQRKGIPVDWLFYGGLVGYALLVAKYGKRSGGSNTG